MTPAQFVLSLALLLAAVFIAAFKTLPKESWQIAAVVPLGKTSRGTWSGLNLTYYGMFVATAITLALSIVTLLFGAAGLPLAAVVLSVLIVLGVCVPSSRWMARLVDGKKYNFTVAGAAAVGMAAVPLGYLVLKAAGYQAPAAVVFAAFATAYAFGEGIGRLACISFGCCYGKRLSETATWIRLLFRRSHFVFHGPTRKIAYESGLDGVSVVPIQAVTCCVSAAAGLFALLIFLEGYFREAFALGSLVCYIWRIYSESLRADHRGGGRVTKYQMIAAAGIVYTIAVVAFLDNPSIRPDLSSGLRAFRDPLVILFHQTIWLAAFVFHGRSKVTGSEISIHVRKDLI